MSLSTSNQRQGFRFLHGTRGPGGSCSLSSRFSADLEDALSAPELLSWHSSTMTPVAQEAMTLDLSCGGGRHRLPWSRLIPLYVLCSSLMQSLPVFL